MIHRLVNTQIGDGHGPFPHTSLVRVIGSKLFCSVLFLERAQHSVVDQQHHSHFLRCQIFYLRTSFSCSWYQNAQGDLPRITTAVCISSCVHDRLAHFAAWQTTQRTRWTHAHTSATADCPHDTATYKSKIRPQQCLVCVHNKWTHFAV